MEIISVTASELIHFRVSWLELSLSDPSFQNTPSAAWNCLHFRFCHDKDSAKIGAVVAKVTRLHMPELVSLAVAIGEGKLVHVTWAFQEETGVRMKMQMG